MTLFSIAITFFLVANPIGNAPTIVALVKDYDFERQKKILLRESLIALLIALFFQFFGEYFLGLLHIKDYALSLCGGILLTIVALNMIFTVREEGGMVKLHQEPFIVPIATPILSGAGLMAIMMLYAKQENDMLKIFLATLLAWVGVVLVVYTAPYLQKILGKRGLIALEQLMGMLLALMAMEMIVKGISLFVNTFE